MAKGPDSILYAGYGANMDPIMIREIIGHRPKDDLGRISIVGYELCIQTLEQIPDTRLPGSSIRKSPKSFIIESWGKNSDFRTYGIRPNPESKVDARLFELTDEDLGFMRRWELTDTGWFKPAEVTVKYIDNGLRTDKGNTAVAVTEILGEGQAAERAARNQEYDVYLNGKQPMHSRAQKVRKEYEDERKSKKKAPENT